MLSRAEARPASAPSRDVVPVLVEQGVAALDAGDARAARDAFLDASSVDAANVTALHGSGLAYLKLGLPKRAAPQLERAYAAAHGTPPRNLVINLAAALVATGNPMRAARVVQDYLQKTPAPDDEAADALAIALENADEQARHGKVWESANAFAKAYATKLAPRHPGMKRWGARWLPASEVDTLEAQVRTQQATVTRVKKDLAAAERDVAAHQAKLDALQRTGHTLDAVNAEQAAIGKAQTTVREKQRELEQATKSTPATDDPKAVALLPLTDTAALAPIAVAVAKPNVSPPPAPPSRSAPINSPPVPPAPPVPPPAAPRATQLARYAAAFAVTTELLVTVASAVADATDVQLQTADGEPLAAEVVRSDGATGLALLRLKKAENPKPLPSFLPLATEFAGGPLKCGGLPTVSLFSPAPELIDGDAPRPTPAAGDAWRVGLRKHPRLAGAPLLTDHGVVGVELASRDDDVSSLPAIPLDRLRQFLADDVPAPPPGINVMVGDPTTLVFQVIARRDVK